MEKGPNFSNDAESSTEKRDGKAKRSEKKIVAPLPFAPEKQRETKTEATEKEAPRPIIPESLLSKLTGEKDDAKPLEPEPKADTTSTVAQYELSPSEMTATDMDAGETGKEYEQTVENQYVRSMAEDLTNGQEISLREAERVPESRDPDIVGEALEIAQAADEATQSSLAPETVPIPVGKLDEATDYHLEATAETESFMPTPDTATDEDDVLPPIAPPTQTFVTPPMPPNPSETYGDAGEPPDQRRYSVSGQGGGRSSQEASSAEVRRIAEDAAWSERQRGRREGVLAGMLLGGGIEHLRHKRREKKAEKQRLKEERKQAKRIEKLEFDYAEARRAQITEKSSKETQVVAPITPERARAPQAEKAEQIAREKKTAEQARREIQEAEMTAEELQLPKDHHIERSAWHAIEVDKQGRAVENATFEYGHEYYAERKHESGPKVPVNEAAGEVALVAAAMDDERQLPASSDGSPQSQYDSSISEPKTTTVNRKKSRLHALTTPPATASGTAAWLAVLVVLVIILIAVAR